MWKRISSLVRFTKKVDSGTKHKRRKQEKIQEKKLGKILKEIL